LHIIAINLSAIFYKKMNAPIILFAYARPQHLRSTVEALQKNPGANQHELIVYADAAKSPDKDSDVNRVRRYLATISGFKSITIHHRPHNFGLAKSIISGVTEVLNAHERVIVLEDDMVTSSHFLRYMNEALDMYEDNERVISVHGYIYPVQQDLPEAFFLRGADCWGWATWRRGWALFNPDGQFLLDELKRKNLRDQFDLNGAYSYSGMLESQIKGANDSWAVRWHASAFLADKLTLYPGRSLVQNIGNDNSGTHCGNSVAHDILLTSTPIDFKEIEVKPSEVGRCAFESFLQKSRGSFFDRLKLQIFKKIKALAR
jgi:Glycosyl transferase family 2